MSLRILFLVQGEGRGHMTQALALAEVLREAGHEVCAAVVGRQPERRLPGFFTRGMGAPIVELDSPAFRRDGRRAGVRSLASLDYNWRRRRLYARNRDALAERVRAMRPDAAVSFFEPLWGLGALARRLRVPTLCVGHQYALQHPSVRRPRGRPGHRLALDALTHVTAAGSHRRVALSFRPMADLPERGLFVAPPLLRAEVRRAEPRAGRHLLVYLLNDGYAGQVEAWHRRHPDVEVRCYWDRAGAAAVEQRAPGLTFHALDDAAFLRDMATCRALATTAGFESVCEAMYLGKPVLTVPVRGHYEQQCNAADAVAAGAGVQGERFDLGRLLDYLPRHRPAPGARTWADRAPEMLLGHVEAVARGEARVAYSVPPAAALAARVLLGA